MNVFSICGDVLWLVFGVLLFTLSFIHSKALCGLFVNVFISVLRVCSGRVGVCWLCLAVRAYLSIFRVGLWIDFVLCCRPSSSFLFVCVSLSFSCWGQGRGHDVFGL